MINLKVITEELSPFEIAERQLNRAISIFLNEEDFISSLTLAGAAEEILGTLLRNAGKKSCLDLQIEFDLLNQDEEVPQAEVSKAKKELSNLRNYYRNRLKHHSEHGIFASTDCLAAEMLDRACYNYFMFSGNETELMRFFKDTVLGGSYYEQPTKLLVR